MGEFDHLFKKIKRGFSFIFIEVCVDGHDPSLRTWWEVSPTHPKNFMFISVNSMEM
jgi:hypothetical protein